MLSKNGTKHTQTHPCPLENNIDLELTIYNNNNLIEIPNTPTCNQCLLTAISTLLNSARTFKTFLFLLSFIKVWFFFKYHTNEPTKLLKKLKSFVLFCWTVVIILNALRGIV